MRHGGEVSDMATTTCRTPYLYTTKRETPTIIDGFLLLLVFVSCAAAASLLGGSTRQRLKNGKVSFIVVFFCSPVVWR